MLLRKAAFHFHQRKERFFRADAMIEVFGRAIPGISNHAATELFLELLRDCVISPQGGELFSFFHHSLQEYFVGTELADDLTLKTIYGAVEDYFRTGSWWEEPLVFFAAIKRDISLLINNLHLHGGDAGNKTRVRRLLDRWLQVADLTPVADLNPRSTVAEVLGEMDVGGLRARWTKIAQLFYATDKSMKIELL
jgi:hypothetical protein